MKIKSPPAKTRPVIASIILRASALLALAGIPVHALAQEAGDFNATASPKGTAVFQPDWKNIGEHYQIPEWFKDAKFGIFICWGVYSVPAATNEWYARNMYQRGTPDFRYHVKKYGTQDKFGYKDFIPLFKAEKFDATEWVALFKEAGVKYVIPIAEHHDGFAMYDSDHNPWNSVKMGPKKDIIGLLKTATENAGLIFGLSSHRLENSFFFNGGMTFPSDVQDKSISLYGFRLPGAYPDKPNGVKYTPAVSEDFLKHTHELIDKYQPQLIWFDWTVDHITPAFNKFLAYYYNNALDWKKGVVVNAKKGFPNNVQVSDIERGATNALMKYPWQTDTSVSKRSWGYVRADSTKRPRHIVRNLVDIVSKNGNLLLAIGPKADGTIADGQKKVLLAIGDWLKVNGEAIYGTRPWIKFGEGPTIGKSGAFSDGRETAFTKEDIRFTTKGNVLYAIALNWGDTILIKSLNKKTVADAKLLHASLLGAEGGLQWQQTEEGLRITFPGKQIGDYAYAIKLTFDKPVGAHLEPESVDLPFLHGDP
ncbi:MAG: alpha-L-fucosidase [Puniceicoccales bacterium]|jgi:alpha-L-fucosidase|nr:alpha-L-fucosidase [Puniceicoccales bacterium]